MGQAQSLPTLTDGRHSITVETQFSHRFDYAHFARPDSYHSSNLYGLTALADLCWGATCN